MNRNLILISVANDKRTTHKLVFPGELDSVRGYLRRKAGDGYVITNLECDDGIYFVRMGRASEFLPRNFGAQRVVTDGVMSYHGRLIYARCGGRCRWEVPVRFAGRGSTDTTTTPTLTGGGAVTGAIRWW